MDAWRAGGIEHCPGGEIECFHNKGLSPLTSWHLLSVVVARSWLCRRVVVLRDSTKFSAHAEVGGTTVIHFSRRLAFSARAPPAASAHQAIVPYAKEATEEFIGHEPEKFVSAETAAAMATAAYRRAVSESFRVCVPHCLLLLKK